MNKDYTEITKSPIIINTINNDVHIEVDNIKFIFENDTALNVTRWIQTLTRKQLKEHIDLMISLGI